MKREILDVIVVGAGPAGLSAALVLGRCLRRVLVVDTDRPRNWASQALHAFLTRDGIPPPELRQIGRDQLAQYDTVTLESGEAVRAQCVTGGFAVTLRDGRRVRSRKLLLATGVMDELPQLEGFNALYGHSVFHCPYCDGWEFRGQPLGVYARGSKGYGLALELKIWSDDIVLCTDGPSRFSPAQQRQLARQRITVRAERVLRLEGTDGQLERVVFAAGPPLPRRALFFNTGQRQQSTLAAQLGCAFNKKGTVSTGKHEATNIPGLYVAGDASRLVQLAIVAAAEGAQAAFAINDALMREDVHA